MLTLDTGRPVPLLRKAGFVDEPDGLWMAVALDDTELGTLDHGPFIPSMRGHELLQRPGRKTKTHGDRLGVLSRKTAQLPRQVLSQVLAAWTRLDALRKVQHEAVERRAQRLQGFDFHGTSSA